MRRRQTLPIEGWQLLVDQRLDGRKAREVATVEQEAVDAQLDERLHLRGDLRGRADESLTSRTLTMSPVSPMDRQAIAILSGTDWRRR